jgi:NAD(P)-dependent dehydrogenase (short-subunit alcohol dehydrogenase family)
MDAMIKTVEDDLGPVDVMVNNAARYAAIGPVWETDPEVWWQDVTINILGVYLGCHAVLPGMLERDSGCVINLIGGGTTTPFPNATAYGTSKAAVMRFTESLAREVKDTGLKVFALDPGLVRTAMTEFIKSSQAGQRWMANIGRMLDEERDGSPTLAADLVVEIAQGNFDTLTGRALFAQSDYEALKGREDEILANDLYTLRMKRLDK